MGLGAANLSGGVAIGCAVVALVSIIVAVALMAKYRKL